MTAHNQTKPNNNTGSSNRSNSNSEPKTIKLYPYRSSEKSAYNYLVGSQFMTSQGSVTKSKQPLPYLPHNLTTYTSLINGHAIPSSELEDSKGNSTHMMDTNMAFGEFSSQGQAQLRLAQLTNTDIGCYMSPPAKNVITMEGVKNNLF